MAGRLDAAALWFAHLLFTIRWYFVGGTEPHLSSITTLRDCLPSEPCAVVFRKDTLASESPCLFCCVQSCGRLPGDGCEPSSMHTAFGCSRLWDLVHQSEWSVAPLDGDAVMASLRACPVPCVELGVYLSCQSLRSSLHR